MAEEQNIAHSSNGAPSVGNDERERIEFTPSQAEQELLLALCRKVPEDSRYWKKWIATIETMSQKRDCWVISSCFTTFWR